MLNGNLKNLPFVSVIIPSLNSEKTLKRCLTTIFQQSYPKEKYEVILIDGGSIDRTLKIAREFPLTIIHEPRKGRGNAYNRGVEEAKGNIIAFLDSDAYAVSSWLETMVNEFKRGHKVAAVHCRLKAPEECNFIQKCIDTVNFKGVGQANGVVYDKKILMNENGFDERLDYLQEDMLEYKIRKRGYRVKIIDKVLIYHFPRETLKEYLKQSVEAGKNEVMLYRLTKDKKILFRIFYRSLSALAPLALLCNIIYGFSAILIFSCIYMFYVFNRTNADYRKPKYFLLIPVITYISSIGSLLGYVKHIFLS